MTRTELAKLGSSKVRKDNALFSLFKKYITEDAGHVFSGGRLPGGCFGCSFANNFRKWSAYVLNEEPKITVMENSKTYKLAQKNYRVYFKGQVLSDQSSDAEWVDWITYAKGDQRRERKEKFSVLPESLQPQKESASGEPSEDKPVKKTKGRPKKTA